MTEAIESKTNGFLSAIELLKIRGIGNNAWDDWQQSEIALPKTGKKYFEPSGSWLQDMQLENGLKNRKRLLEIERVDRNSQLASAEWLPDSQRALVTKKSGQKWDAFGYVEKTQLYLLPEEALILLEMNHLELYWNGMPLSIQQAYEILIHSENSKCSLDEYRVYSQLIKCGYKLQRFRYKSLLDSKIFNTTKRIIMNPDGLWTPNASPPADKQMSNNFSAAIKKKDDKNEEVLTMQNMGKSDNDKSSKTEKIEIVSEETVLGSFKIIKSDLPPATEVSTYNVTKWPGLRIQGNVKLMPKRNDLINNKNNKTFNSMDQSSHNPVSEKRKLFCSTDLTAKKSRPEVIELSDDEIEEIPRPMTRMEILNTFPNLANQDSNVVVAKISRTYLPQGVKPIKDVYCFNSQRLLNLSQTDGMLRSKAQVVPMNNNHNGQTSHFYSQPSQCQALTTFSSNSNGFSNRGMRYQRDGAAYIHQNVSHNTIQNSFSGTIFQSNCVNFVMEVMGNMVRSYRQQQFQQTTFCQNLQIFSSRFPLPSRFPFSSRFQAYSEDYYNNPMRYQYCKRGGVMASPRGKGGYRYCANESQKPVVQEEPCQPSFSKRPNVNSWLELKKRWREESTITIEDEEPMQMDSVVDINEVQVVEESVSPLISSTSRIFNLSQVYDRLKIIKSTTDRTVRSRKVDYSLSYEVYPTNQPYRKASPGKPLCRLYIINSKKESFLDASKLQRLQQESKDIPVVVAFVSQSCISYIQPGTVFLPDFS